MKTVAIISEYNPFHLGHEYQIRKIREEFGNDTRIIAIMSGNFTQRGDCAIMDKSLRAEIAVRCGVNLVVELPFPFSVSSAEFFAKSGVKIANELSIIDYISFGSECGDTDTLIEIADVLLTEEYKETLSHLISENLNLGYPVLCEMAYNKVAKNTLKSDFFTPNNILGIEYIKALRTLNSKIKPHTITRIGADYSEEYITKDTFQSATAIRNLLSKNDDSAFKYIPKNAEATLFKAYKNQEFPCDSERLAPAVISHFRLNPANAKANIHDASGGLYNRLQNSSFEANTISQLTELADTKKYTSARIRRAIWYSFFGVTSSKVKELPLYTQVLAMDNVGKSILREAKKVTDFPIVTKPSSLVDLSKMARLQKADSDKADCVFQLTKPKLTSGAYSLTRTPFIMK